MSNGEYFGEAKAKLTIDTSEISQNLIEAIRESQRVADKITVKIRFEADESTMKKQIQKQKGINMAASKAEEKLVFRVEDGWLKIEKRFLEKLVEYIDNTENPYIEDFFNWSGMNAQRASGIVSVEKRATVFNEKTALFINDHSEYFAINKYKEYYIDGHSCGVMKFEN